MMAAPRACSLVFLAFPVLALRVRVEKQKDARARHPRRPSERDLCLCKIEDSRCLTQDLGLYSEPTRVPSLAPFQSNRVTTVLLGYSASPSSLAL